MVHRSFIGFCYLNCLAKALYDNVAEAPDELAFRKGDILTVLEQNTNSLEGWWLCSLRGRQGIVPGNRLRLLPGMYDPTGLGNAGTNGVPDVSHALRRSWSSNPNKVVTPQKIGAVYLYDIPPGTKFEKTEAKSSSPIQRYPLQGSLAGSYDTPPTAKPVRIEAYDEPRPHPCRSPLPSLSVYDSPKSNAPVSVIDQPGIHDYDIPSADQTGAYDIPRSDKDNTHIITISDNYDVPPTSYKGSPPIYDGRAFSRSSGDTSGSSSFRSPSGSHSSIETLSLSSVGGSNRSSLEQHPGDLYDIPPEPQPVLDTRMAHPQIRTSGTSVPYQSSLAQETYDIPSNNMPTQFYDIPATKPVKAQLVVDGVYDIPPQATRDSSPVPRTDIVDSISQISLANSDLPDGKAPIVLPECSELLLDREAAVELLMKYQHEVQSSISKLFSFVSTTWRKYENMNAKLSDIETTCHKLQSSLVDFFNFAQGTLANSAHAADKSLCFKLNKLLNPIKESCTTVKNCVQTLDEKGWIAAKLAYADESYAPDELDMLVACARNLVEDVRQIASLIQGNSTLLFKSQTVSEKSKPPVAPKPNLKDKQLSIEKSPKVQERPLPPTPANMMNPQINCGEYFNEYDYVNLESKETVEKENESIKAALPKDMCQSFDELVKQSEVPVVSHTENVPEVAVLEKTILPLDQKDVQLLLFYGVQIETHIMHLTNAIDAFLMTIKNNQPPKVFVGHSKFIIIGAHKLVYIGDSVYRNLNNPDLKTRIMHNSNSLCDSLKTLVSNTKKAASEFPSVLAVQEMVDSVVDVSHLANDLKMSINVASKS